MRDEAIHVQQVGKARCLGGDLVLEPPELVFAQQRSAPIAAPAVISGKRATNW
jgi:hypothetical protein